MNNRQAYAMRADAVRLLRELGWKIVVLAAVFKTTPETIRQLEARGRRNHDAERRK